MLIKMSHLRQNSFPIDYLAHESLVCKEGRRPAEQLLSALASRGSLTSRLQPPCKPACELSLLSLGWADRPSMLMVVQRPKRRICANPVPLIRKSPAFLVMDQKLYLHTWNLPCKVKSNKQKPQNLLLKADLLYMFPFLPLRVGCLSVSKSAQVSETLYLKDKAFITLGVGCGLHVEGH